MAVNVTNFDLLLYEHDDLTLVICKQYSVGKDFRILLCEIEYKKDRDQNDLFLATRLLLFFHFNSFNYSKTIPTVLNYVLQNHVWHTEQYKNLA